MLPPRYTRFSAVILTILAVGGMPGCTSSSSAPESGSTSSTQPDAGTADAEAGTANGPLTPPEGNSEPPLDDVSQAVADVPTAENAASSTDSAADAVTLKVVSPEDFKTIIASHKGKVVLVDFWASWCVPCRKAFPLTVEMAKKHADDGLVVISMCFDDQDSKADSLECLKENGATFENLMCRFGGETESFEAYEIGDSGLPYYRVYDRNGQMQAFKNDIDAGKGVDEAEVQAAVEALLKAK